MHCKMVCFCNGAACQNSLKLRSAFEPVHKNLWLIRVPRSTGKKVQTEIGWPIYPVVNLNTQFLDSEPLAAFSPAGSNYGASTACFHAGQKAVRTCALYFGGLVGAFHSWSSCLL